MRLWTASEIEARREDLAWMVAHGETVEGACYRLGLARSSLDKWCQHHGATDLWAQLMRNGNTVECGHGARRGGVPSWVRSLR